MWAPGAGSWALGAEGVQHIWGTARGGTSVAQARKREREKKKAWAGFLNCFKGGNWERPATGKRGSKREIKALACSFVDSTRHPCNFSEQRSRSDQLPASAAQDG